MTENLSKQLCELCGIEPKYYFYDSNHKVYGQTIQKKN